MYYKVLSRDELLGIYRNHAPSKVMMDTFVRIVMRRECNVFRIFEIIKGNNEL